MDYRKLYFLCITFLLVLLASCDDDNPPAPIQLPEKTQVGAGTFGAIVNGEVWSFNIYGHDVSGGAVLDLSDLLYVYGGFSSRDRDESIGFTIRTQVGEGEYYLSSESDRRSGVFEYRNFEHHCFYINSSENNSFYEGTVKITRFDRYERIISGEFEYVIDYRESPEYGNDCGEVRVTDGRFDLKF
ncbi:hypothetical protein [Roseivirga pacifica]|uniref:hypothetical protein n=1 Tax=Roseivirga pacifica TaxID=1267423 RepID=UPI003BAEFDD7